MAKVRIRKNEYLDLNKETDVKLLDDIFKKVCGRKRAKAIAWGTIGIFGIVKAIRHYGISERNYGGKTFTEEILENIKDE